VVAEVAGAVLGWGALSRFHTREAYLHTVENSVYVHHEHHRRGLAAALLAELIALARQHGHHTIIADIDGEQAPSLALHERYGFERVGQLKAVGYKFNRWLDVVCMQYTL
jgi:phosphinothricin acetyltransferase